MQQRKQFLATLGAAFLILGSALSGQCLPPAKLKPGELFQVKPGDLLRVKSSMFNFRNDHVVAQLAGRKFPLFSILTDNEADILIPALQPQTTWVILLAFARRAETCGNIEIVRTNSLQVVVQLDANQFSLVSTSPSSKEVAVAASGRYQFRVRSGGEVGLVGWLPGESEKIELFGATPNGLSMSRVDRQGPVTFTFVIPNPDTAATIQFLLQDPSTKELRPLNEIQIPAGGRP